MTKVGNLKKTENSIKKVDEIRLPEELVRMVFHYGALDNSEPISKSVKCKINELFEYPEGITESVEESYKNVSVIAK